MEESWDPGKSALLQDGPAAAWSLFADQVRQTSRRMPGGLTRLEWCVFRSDEQSRHLLLEGIYEEKERFASKRYIRRDVPVIELGGSLGVVSCLLNRRQRFPDHHVVVEANPANLLMLIENRDRNGCKFQILHRAGVEEDCLFISAMARSPPVRLLWRTIR